MRWRSKPGMAVGCRTTGAATTGDAAGTGGSTRRDRASAALRVEPTGDSTTVGRSFLFRASGEVAEDIVDSASEAAAHRGVLPATVAVHDAPQLHHVEVTELL